MFEGRSYKEELMMELLW